MSEDEAVSDAYRAAIAGIFGVLLTQLASVGTDGFELTRDQVTNNARTGIAQAREVRRVMRDLLK